MGSNDESSGKRIVQLTFTGAWATWWKGKKHESGRGNADCFEKNTTSLHNIQNTVYYTLGPLYLDTARKAPSQELRLFSDFLHYNKCLIFGTIVEGGYLYCNTSTPERL